jgi:hypothetical protein
VAHTDITSRWRIFDSEWIAAWPQGQGRSYDCSVLHAWPQCSLGSAAIVLAGSATLSLQTDWKADELSNAK